MASAGRKRTKQKSLEGGRAEEGRRAMLTIMLHLMVCKRAQTNAQVAVSLMAVAQIIARPGKRL